MTLGHFLYIPGVLCLGLLIGYILGGRAAEVARADKDQLARRRAARQAARHAGEAADERGEAGGGAAADKPPAP